jgi:hypothetical protein
VYRDTVVSRHARKSAAGEARGEPRRIALTRPLRRAAQAHRLERAEAGCRAMASHLQVLPERDASAEQQSAGAEDSWSDPAALIAALSDEPQEAPGMSERLLAQLEHLLLFAGVEISGGLPPGWLAECRVLFERADDAESIAEACALLLVALRTSTVALVQADVTAFCGSVATALRTHRTDLDVQLFGVRVLCAMRSLPGFDAEVALDAVLLAQHEGVDDTKLQTTILSILSLFARDGNLARYLVQRGAVDDLAAVMQLRVQSADFQLKALSLAEMLLKHVPADFQVDSFIEAACASLDAHKADSDVVGRGTMMLANLFVYSEQLGRLLTLRDECLHMVMDILELHASAAQASSSGSAVSARAGSRFTEISAGCWAIFSVLLQRHHAVYPADVAERLVVLAVATLKAPGADASRACTNALSFCCSVLADLCLDEDRLTIQDPNKRASSEAALLKLAREAGALDVLAGVMGLRVDEAVYKHACRALQHLITGNKENRDAALACGLANVLLERLTASYADTSRLHTLFTLGMLAEDPNFAKHATLANAAEVVVDSLGQSRRCAEPDLGSWVCHNGLKLLHRLLHTASFKRLRDCAASSLIAVAGAMGVADDTDSQYAGCRMITLLTHYCLDKDLPSEVLNALPDQQFWLFPVAVVIRALCHKGDSATLKSAGLNALCALLNFIDAAGLPNDTDTVSVVLILLTVVHQYQGQVDVLRAVAATFDALMLSPDKLIAFLKAAPIDVAHVHELFHHHILYKAGCRLLVMLVQLDPQRYGSYAASEFVKLCIRLLRSPCGEESRAFVYSILLALVKCDESIAAAAFSAGFLSLPKSKQACAARAAFEAKLAGFGAAAEQAADAAAAALLAEEQAEAAAKSSAQQKRKAKKKPATRAAAAAAAEADAASAEGDAPSAPDTPPHELASTEASADAEPERAEDAESAELSQSESAVRRRRRAATKAARRGADTSPDAAGSTEPPPAGSSTDTPAGDAAADAAGQAAEPAAGFTDVARSKSKRGSKKSADADAAPKAPPTALPPRSPAPPAPQLSGDVLPLASRPALPLPRPAASSAPLSAPAAPRATPSMPAYLLPTPRAELQQPFSPPAAPLSVPYAALLQPTAPTPLPYNPFGDAASSGSVLPPAAPSIFDTLYGTAPRAALPDASAHGLSNATGEYNCFLNSIVQALFHVRCFREHLLRSRVLPRPSNLEQQRSIALVRALGDLVEALEHGAALRRDAGAAGAQQAVAPTALRLALAELSAAGGEGAMNAMADAAEVLSALYEAFQAVSVANRPGVAPADTSIGRMFGIGVREAAHCAAAGCGKITHSIAFNSFFHIVPRCATVWRGIDACCAALPCPAARLLASHAML